MNGTLTIDIPGLPVPWARAGGNNKVRFTPARQRGAMADIKVIASQVMGQRKPLDGPLSVRMTFTYPWPASWSMKKRAANGWKTSRCDLSNLQKLVEDALIGVAFVDDALIVQSFAEKLYGETARTRVHIEPVGLPL